MVRDLVRHPERRDELLGSAAALKLIGATVVGVAVLIATQLNGMDGFTMTMVLIMAAAELFKPFSVIEYYFHSRVEGKAISRVNMVQALVSAGFKLWLCIIHAPLMWFAWSYVVDQIAGAVAFALVYRSSGGRMKHWSASWHMIGRLLRESWPLIIYGVALMVHARIDQVMIFDVLKGEIGEKEAYAEVGQYSVALKMIEALGFLPIIIQSSLAPAITRARMEDPAKYHDRLLNQYRLMFAVFLVMAVPLYFFAKPIIVLLYGEEFAPAGYLLSLFAIRLFFTNMGLAKSSWITNESLFKYSLITAIAGAVTNVTMNYFLIPEFRSIGAIWATIGSFLVSIFLMDLLMKETRGNFKAMCLGIATFWKIDRVR